MEIDGSGHPQTGTPRMWPDVRSKTRVVGRVEITKSVHKGAGGTRCGARESTIFKLSALPTELTGHLLMRSRNRGWSSWWRWAESMSLTDLVGLILALGRGFVPTECRFPRTRCWYGLPKESMSRSSVNRSSTTLCRRTRDKETWKAHGWE